MTPTRAQIRAIHTLKNALQMSEENYRTLLSSFGAQSSVDLTVPKAKELIEVLSAQASAAGVWVARKRPRGKLEFDELGNRPGFASPPQLRKICARWTVVSRAEPEHRREALEQFLGNKFGIEKLKWLPDHLVAKVLRILAAMEGQS